MMLWAFEEGVGALRLRPPGYKKYTMTLWQSHHGEPTESAAALSAPAGRQRIPASKITKSTSPELSVLQRRGSPDPSLSSTKAQTRRLLISQRSFYGVPFDIPATIRKISITIRGR